MKKNTLSGILALILAVSLSSCMLFGGAYPNGGYGYTYSDPYQTSTSTSTSTTQDNSNQNSGSNSQSSEDSDFWSNLYWQYFGDTGSGNTGNTGNIGGNTGNSGNYIQPNPIATSPNTQTQPSSAYLSKLEQEVLAELNLVRQNPANYARQVLYAYRNSSSAANECYQELLNTKNLNPLSAEKGLYLAAKWFVDYQGPRGEVGHESATSGYVQPWDRMNQFGSWSGGCAENVSYGYNTAREIVLQLLIDDGVANRGHRRAILSSTATKVGIACGSHSKYRYMCVMDFANSYATASAYAGSTGSSSTTSPASSSISMSQIEVEILAELNLVRRNPANYANQVLYSYRNSSGAASECYNELLRTSPMGELTAEKGLYQAARWFADYQGPRGDVGHQSAVSGYVQPWDRMNQYGTWSGGSAENVSYGCTSAREIVLQLLIDDGVADRGHRKNILNPSSTKVGVAYGTHSKYGTMCVMDFAYNYKSK